jgi:hypothetical protein
MIGVAGLGDNIGWAARRNTRLQAEIDRYRRHVRIELELQQLERERMRIETRAAQRAAKRLPSCPACGFGGYNGRCIACTHVAGARIEQAPEHRSAAEEQLREQLSCRIEHAGALGEILGVR